MWKLGLRPRYQVSGNISFKFSAFCLCSVPPNIQTSPSRHFQLPSADADRGSSISKTSLRTGLFLSLCYNHINLRGFKKSSLLQAGRLHAAAEVQQRGGRGAAQSTHGSPQSHRNSYTPTPHITPPPLPTSIS
jgi:hypothetical protein